jgi:hypothetical protein
MTGSGVQEIGAGMWRWQHRPRGLRRGEFGTRTSYALVFGDAVVETGQGELRVWEDPLDSERRRRWWNERYRPTLERLATLDVEHVLVTHGQSALGDGTGMLRRALERDPWQRPKR